MQEQSLLINSVIYLGAVVVAVPMLTQLSSAPGNAVESLAQVLARHFPDVEV